MYIIGGRPLKRHVNKMNREQRQKLHELLPSVDLVWLLRALVVSVMTVKDLAEFVRYAVFHCFLCSK